MIPSCRSLLMRSRSSTIGQPLDLLVQAGVLDGDRGVDGRTSRRAPGRPRENSRGAGLVGQVQVPDRSALHRDRDAEEAVHRRVVRREAVATRVDGDVRDPERLVLADDQAEEAVAAGQRRRSHARVAAVHAGRDEALDDAVVVDDPQRGVARPTSGRTWSTMTCRTSSTDASPAIARVAASRASTTRRRRVLRRSRLTMRPR